MENKYKEILEAILSGVNSEILLRKGNIKKLDSNQPLSIDNIEICEDGVKIKQTKKTTVIDESWIIDFRNKFRAVNRLKGGKGGLKLVIQKMTKFMEDYSYTKEQILEATDNYIAQLPPSASYDDMSMMSADYFISFTSSNKEVSSRLAYYCELLTDNSSKAQLRTLDVEWNR